MADTQPDQRKPGRPRIYDDPRQRFTLEISRTLLEGIDEHISTTGQSRTAWIEAAIREKLARDEGYK